MLLHVGIADVGSRRQGLQPASRAATNETPDVYGSVGRNTLTGIMASLDTSPYMKHGTASHLPARQRRTQCIDACSLRLIRYGYAMIYALRMGNFYHLWLSPLGCYSASTLALLSMALGTAYPPTTLSAGVGPAHTLFWGS